MKTKTAIWLILIASVISFFAGRQTITKEEIARYVTGETVHGRLDPDFLTVKQEFKTDIGFLPYIFWKADTVILNDTSYIEVIPDTAKIIEDFLIKREYEFNVFDNQNGKLDVNSVVQYNRLQSFNYSFTPIHREIIRSRERSFTPFMSGSYNTFDVVGVGGGLFIRNIGLEYNYLYQLPTNQTGHEIGFKVKF